MGISNTFQNLSAGNWGRKSLERGGGVSGNHKEDCGSRELLWKPGRRREEAQRWLPAEDLDPPVASSSLLKVTLPKYPPKYPNPLFLTHFLPKPPIGGTHTSTRGWERTWNVHRGQSSGRKQEQEQEIGLEDHLSKEGSGVENWVTSLQVHKIYRKWHLKRN